MKIFIHQSAILCLLFLFVLNVSLTFGQIRGTEWGQSKNLLKESLEKGTFSEVDQNTHTIVLQNTTIAGDPGYISY